MPLQGLSSALYHDLAVPLQGLKDLAVPLQGLGSAFYKDFKDLAVPL